MKVKLNELKADEVAVVLVEDNVWSIIYYRVNGTKEFMFEGKKILVLHSGWSCFVAETGKKDVMAVAVEKNMEFNIEKMKVMKFLKGRCEAEYLSDLESPVKLLIDENQCDLNLGNDALSFELTLQ